MRISDWSSDVCSSDLLDEEIVQREPVARRVDARVDDIAAGEVNAPRHAIEEPRMIRGEHHHQRRAAIVVGNRRDVERSVTRLPDMDQIGGDHLRSEEHTSELQSLMRITYAVFC